MEKITQKVKKKNLEFKIKQKLSIKLNRFNVNNKSIKKLLMRKSKTLHPLNLKK